MGGWRGRGHDYEVRCQANPALYTRCGILWVDRWSPAGMLAVPRLVLGPLFETLRRQAEAAGGGAAGLEADARRPAHGWERVRRMVVRNRSLNWWVSIHAVPLAPSDLGVDVSPIGYPGPWNPNPAHRPHVNHPLRERPDGPTEAPGAARPPHPGSGVGAC